MDFNDLGYAISVAYEDLSDVWPVVADVRELPSLAPTPQRDHSSPPSSLQALLGRVPLRKVTLTNKLGATVVVDSLPLQFFPALDPALQRLQQYRHSAVAWFRRPAASIVLLSCGDAEDYRRNFRLQLRAMIDPETRHPLDPEPVFVYVAPPAAATAEADARGAARVVDAMRRELGSRARERIVRIDAVPVSSSASTPGAGAGPAAAAASAPAGIEDLVAALKAAIAASIEARISSYGEVVRRHLALLQAGAPTVTFPDFYLIKDALAVMMEGTGLVEDAVREYYELEVAHQQAEDLGIRRRRSNSGGGEDGTAGGFSAFFGAPPRGVDEAAGIWASWRASRLAVQAGDAAASAAAMAPLAVKQALFANQSRVLLKLRRHAEVLDRGLSFLQHCYASLAAQEVAAAGPAGLKEAWTFAGSVSLAAAVAALQAAALQGANSATAAAPGPALSSETSAFLLGVLSGSADSGDAEGDDSEFDWRLGAPPPALPEGVKDDAAWAASRAVYCLLGQLYCLARQQLGVLGAAAGLEPPRFDADLAAVAAELPAGDANASAAAASPWATASVSEAHSPRRSLQKVRSMSPTRISQDLGSMRGSFIASGPIGGGGPGSLSGVESGDEAASLSIKTRQESAALTQENLQTVDLNAAGAAGGGEEEAAAAGPLAAAALRLTPDGAPLDREASKGSLSAAERGVEVAPVVPTGPGSPVPPLGAGLPRTRSEGSEPQRPSTAASTRASETDSAVSTPRTVGADATAAAASAAAGASAADPGTSMRLIERALDALMVVQAESGAQHHRRASSAASAASTAAPSLLLSPRDSMGAWEPGSTWTPVHWRLRRALASPAAFRDLWKELTVAAAAAFEAGGRRRQALLCGAEAAECLAAAGDMEAAVEALEVHCRTALEEGWTAVAAAALPKLAACQAALGHPGLPHTAAALVSLAASDRNGAALFPPSVAKAAATLLMRAAAQPSAALPLPPPLLPSRKASNAAYAGAFSAQIDTGTIDLSAALAAGPAHGHHSRFFRQNDALGHPILLPTHPPGSQPSNNGESGATPLPLPSHPRCAVGDVAVVTLRVINRLPATLDLSDVRLGLVGMQEITALASPRVSSPDPLYRLTMQSMQHQRGSRSSIGGSTPMQGPTPSVGRAGGAGGGPTVPHSPSPFYRTDSFADEGPRFTTEWKDTEDLSCCLLDATPGEKGAPGAVALPSPSTAPVALAPGINTLRFVAAPVKRGLYRPAVVTAALGNLLISLDVEGRIGDGSGSSGSGLLASVFHSDAAGPYADTETSVVLEVEPPQPRVEVTAASASGGAALVAGQRQWLGLRLSSTRDALDGATLAVTWPSPPDAVDIARKVSGMPPAAAPAAAAAASSAAVPASLGLANASSAALVAHGADAENGALVPAVAATGLGAWAADGTEEVTLPSGAAVSSSAEGGSDATVWWWVDAGPTAAAAMVPPEQIKVTAPGGTTAAGTAYPQSQMHQTSFYHSIGGPLGASPPDEGLALDSAGAGVPPPPLAASPELPLTLQYLSGCRRTFSTVLHLPLRLPFSVRAAARELPSGAILAHFHVTSLCPSPVTLSAASLQPQPGLTLVQDLCADLGLLPVAALDPGAAFSFSFLLEVDRAMAVGDRAAAQLRMQAAAKLQPTALQLTYEVASTDACSMDVPCSPAAAGGSPGGGMAPTTSGHRTTVHGEAAAAAAGGSPGSAGSSGLRLPPVSALKRLQEHSTASSAVDATTSQTCVFIHHCCLELSPLGADIPGAVVLVQLLGPFTAIAGQPVSLCWRLERAGAAGECGSGAAASAEPLAVRFELAADGDAWRPLGRRQGVVVLEPHDGAMATVEATWVPAATGALPVPTMSLADVAYQAIVDVGQKAGAEYIVVAPPQ